LDSTLASNLPLDIFFLHNNERKSKQEYRTTVNRTTYLPKKGNEVQEDEDEVGSNLIDGVIGNDS
jgi:hypothetical protein